MITHHLYSICTLNYAFRTRVLEGLINDELMAIAMDYQCGFIPKR
jgi:hypothetical protein